VDVKLEFLAEEGQVRAEAIVRHIKPGEGAGLKFVAVLEEDFPRLATLIARVRRLPCPGPGSRHITSSFPL
jgi:hypothetical protein